MARKRKDSTRWIGDLEPGGLHRTTNTPKGERVPEAKVRSALAGNYGEKGRKQAQAAKNLAGLRGKKKGKKKK